MKAWIARNTARTPIRWNHDGSRADAGGRPIDHEAEDFPAAGRIWPLKPPCFSQQIQRFQTQTS
jgi:hypothetical protein